MPSTNLPLRRWLSPLIAVSTGLVLFALILPAIQRAREAARTTQSRNNLRMLGLAMHNYHDVHGRFPPGAIVDSENRGHHGWYTQLMPYIDASPEYNRINFDLPWDDRLNDHIFRSVHAVCQVPGVDAVATDEGYSLIHYLGNPNLLHRNSHTTLDEIHGGLRNVWMLGEAAGDFQPRAYPYNWRAAGDCLNCGPHSFGRPDGMGALFLFCDGSVQLVSSEIDDGQFQTMAAAGPQLTTAAISESEHRFVTIDHAWNVRRIPLHGDESGDGICAQVWFDGEGVPETASFVACSKWTDDSPTLADMSIVVSRFPEIRELLGAPTVNDEGARILTQLNNLEILTTAGINVSDAGLSDLTRLTKLELVVGRTEADIRSALHSALLDCEIRTGP